MTRKLQQEEYKTLISNMVWLIFGPTRTGKSTLLARIKSMATAPKFCELMSETKGRENEPVLIEGVETSFGHVSRTTVPNTHILGDKLVLDLAGFLDANSKRAAVISILNNSLFSSLRRCKIMIVSRLSALFEMGNVIKIYNEEFGNLMTEDNIISGLSSSVFVFTHCDEHWHGIYDQDEITETEYDEKTLHRSVKSQLNNFAAQYSMKNPPIGRFAAFMANHFCLINYQTDDQKNVLEKLDRAMGVVDELQTDTMRFNVQGANNDLEKEASKVISDFHNYAKTIFDTQVELINTTSQNIDIWESENASVSTSMYNSLRRIHENIKSISKKKDKLLLLDNKSKELEIIKAKSKTELEQATKQLEVFVHDATNIVILNIIVLKSIMRDKIEKIRTEVQNPPGCINQTHIFCYDIQIFEENKSRIQSCRSLRELTELKLPTYFNNGYINSNEVNIDISMTLNGSQISSSSKKPHIVVCASEVKIQEANYVNMITGYFENQISHLKKTSTACDDDLKKIQYEINILVSELTKLNEQVSKDTENINSGTLIVKQNLNSIKMKVVELERFNNDVHERMELLVKDSTFRSTEELCILLKDSNVVIQNLDMFSMIQFYIKQSNDKHVTTIKTIASIQQRSSNSEITCDTYNRELQDTIESYNSLKSPRS